MRALTATMKVGIPGPEGSIAKLQWSSTNQALTELAVEIGGDRGAAPRAASGPTASCARARTRSRAGPRDVLKNIVAERVLGLPKLR